MSLQDSLFSEDVERDIEEFAVKEIRKRVLVFPPVNNYRRFLIHQFVQYKYHDLLYTFSIGQGPRRRTVVCYKTDVIRDPKLNGALYETCRVSKISDSACAMGVEGHTSPLVSPENSRQRQVKSVPSVGIYRPPPARKARCDNRVDSQQDSQSASDSSQSSKGNRQKRPDRAVYVPRHRRSNETEDSSSFSREISKAPKTTRERRSTTTSPAHTSSRSFTDNSGVGFDSCRTIHGGDHVFDGRDAPIDLGADKTERNLSCAFESLVRSDFVRSDVSVDRETISSSFGSTDNSSDKIAVDKLTNSEADAPSEDKTRSRASELTFNGINEKSRDICLTEESGKVQRDTEIGGELRQQDETGLILDGCGGGAKELGIVGDKERTMEVAKEEIAAIETEKNTGKERNGDNLELIMSRDFNKKEEKTKEELLNREEVVNHKNRRIIRQNLVSDVLLISDDEPRRETVIKEPQVAPISPLTQTKEKKIKKVERPKSKPAPPPLPPSKVNRDECDWDSLFDDNGDCLDPTLIEELTTAVGEVTIEQPRSDYRAYSKAPVEVSNDEFAHVVEIYNFPSDFKTCDLAAVFSPFKNGGFELKWVDDTHCLGVFSSPLIAAEVLASDHSFVKTRPLSEATALSKTKARRSAEFLQPYKARPETCPALARRLVSGALGVRLATASQEREKEKIVLREAKERRRLANKQRADAWEGIIAEK